VTEVKDKNDKSQRELSDQVKTLKLKLAKLDNDNKLKDALNEDCNEEIKNLTSNNVFLSKNSTELKEKSDKLFQG
jgi:hypothetical protein